MARANILTTVLAVGAIGVAAAVTPAVITQADAANFKGKKITLIVPYKEGGGSTIHARFYAPLLEKYLPGNPSVIVRNIKGGGSIKGINYFAARAKTDGTMIASTGTATFFKYVLGNKSVKYPLPEFIAFLNSPFGAVVYARTEIAKEGIAGVRALRKITPVYGGSGPTAGDLPALFSLSLLGIKPKTVFGMSNGKARRAFKRNEINLNYDNMASWSKKVVPMVKKGVATPLYTYGFRNASGQITRDPKLKGVPTFLEVYKAIHGKELSGAAKQVWLTLFNIRVMGSKMFVLPVGTPKDIVDTYVATMRKILNSPEFQSKQAKKILGGYPQALGSAARKTQKAAAIMGEKDKAFLKAWLMKTYGISG